MRMASASVGAVAVGMTHFDQGQRAPERWTLRTGCPMPGGVATCTSHTTDVGLAGSKARQLLCTYLGDTGHEGADDGGPSERTPPIWGRGLDQGSGPDRKGGSSWSIRPSTHPFIPRLPGLRVHAQPVHKRPRWMDHKAAVAANATQH